MHAQVIREHGDSEVVLWSSASVGGMPLRSWPGWAAAHEASIATRVRTAAYEIIKRKGPTSARGLHSSAEVLRNALVSSRA